MKVRALVGTVLAPMLLLGGCDNIFGLDNYDEPNATLSGRIVYNGQPVHLRTGGIELELWEPGFELLEKIPVYVGQDGAFSATLFNGSYKLNAIRGQGPWLVTDDTIQVTVSGTTTQDFPVTPYYMVGNPSFTYVPPGAGGGDEGRINATFSIETIVPSTQAGYRQLQYAALYVATTSFVDRTNRVALEETDRVDLPATWETAPVTLGVDLPEDIRLTPSPVPRTHVQARVGIKVVGISEMIFSPITQVAID